MLLPEWEPSGAAPGFRFRIAISEDLNKYFDVFCVPVERSAEG
jgi:hypothetical protein